MLFELLVINGFLVSKETVVLRPLESEKKILVLSNDLIKLNYHCERFRRLMFQVLAL